MPPQPQQPQQLQQQQPTSIQLAPAAIRRSSAIFLAFSLQLIFLTSFTGATCNKAQSSSCLRAAADGQLDQLPGGGQCMVKQYVQYTHLCKVTNYMPTIDYCCCLFDERLLCCRYHQNWYHFRCMDSEDELETRDSDASYSMASLEIPLLTLLPAILCPLIVLATCVICWTKCWCYRYETDSSSSSSSSSSELYCCTSCKGTDDKDAKSPGRGFADEDDATAPLQSFTLTDFQGSSSVQCLRVLHPYTQPPTVPSPVVAADRLPAYQCNCPPLRIEPTAPALPSDGFDSHKNPDDQLPSIGAGQPGSLRILPGPAHSPAAPQYRQPVASHHHGACPRATYDDLPTEVVLQHACCACSAFPEDRTHFRCNCDGRAAAAYAAYTARANAHARAHAPCAGCADCLPPAYESLQADADRLQS